MKRLTPEWCDEHWSPYRGPNADGVTPNGVYAAMAIMQAFLDSPIFAELTDRSPEALNRNIRESATPLCCRLGADVMKKILDDATGHGSRENVRPRP